MTWGEGQREPLTPIEPKYKELCRIGTKEPKTCNGGIIEGMNTVIDGETGEVLSDEEDLNYEETTHEGKPARFYPKTGAVMQETDDGRFIIVANRGGAENWDGKAMVALREIKKEEAIQRGLENAAIALDLRSADEMLSKIVAFRANVAATSADRTGNNDAKFIFGLVSQSLGEQEGAPALRLDMDKETAQELKELVKWIISL